MGYEDQLTILRDFVCPLRKQPKRQAILWFETPPGKKAQTGLVYMGEYLLNDTLQDVYGFILILGYSRMNYIEFTTNMNLENLMKYHMNAFFYFNRILDQIFYYNMKIVVIEHSPLEVRFNRNFKILGLLWNCAKGLSAKETSNKREIRKNCKVFKGKLFFRESMNQH